MSEFIASILAGLIANGAFSIVGEQKKETIHSCMFDLMRSVENDFRIKFPELVINESFLVREKNVEQLTAWVLDKNIFKERLDLSNENFDGTTASSEQMEFLIERVRYHVRHNQLLRDHVGRETATRTLDNTEEIKKIISNVDFDQNVVNNSINKYLDDGRFDIVSDLLLVMNQNAKALILLSKMKLLYYQSLSIPMGTLDGFLALSPEKHLIVDLAEFLCIHYQEKSHLIKILTFCEDERLSRYIQMICDDRQSELFEGKTENDINVFQMKEEYACDIVALIIMANKLKHEGVVLNLYAIFERANEIRFNFFASFQCKKMRVDHIFNFDNYKLNPTLEKELVQILDDLLKMKSIFDICADALKLEYYQLTMLLLSTFRSDEFSSLFVQLPEAIKNDVEIKRIFFANQIDKREFSESKEIEEYCIATKQYLLLSELLKRTKSEKEIVLFFEDHKFILRKDFVLLKQYIECVEKIHGKAMAIDELKKNHADYCNNFDYDILCHKLSENDSDYDELSECFSQKSYSHAAIREFSFLLLRANKKNKAIEVLRKHARFHFELRLLLAEFMIAEKESQQEVEALVNGFLLEGYVTEQIFFLKARILFEKGMQLCALEFLEKSFSVNSKNLDTVLNILSVRWYNLKSIEDEVLLCAKMIDDPNAQLLVAISYKQIGQLAQFDYHIKKALLLCDDYDEQIYSNFVSTRITDTNPDKVVTMSSVGENTMVKLESPTEQLNICIYGDDGILPKKGSNFADAKHIDTTSELAVKLFQRKKSETLNIENNEYQIAEIVNVDVFLFRFCLDKLGEKGKITPVYFDPASPQKALDEILGVIKKGEKHQKKIMKFYTAPKGCPAIINMIASSLGKKYHETMFHLLLSPEIIFWNNANNEALSDDKVVVVTYNTLAILFALDINCDEIRSKENLYITTSTKKQISQDLKDDQNRFGREDVAILVNCNDSLGAIIYSDDAKRESISFINGIQRLSSLFVECENKSDFVLAEYGKPKIKEMLGVFDYDSIALFNRDDAVIVTDDCWLSLMIKNTPEVVTKTCGIVDLLIYLDIDVARLIKALLKMKEYKFYALFSINSIKYITEKLPLINNESEKESVASEIQELFALPQEKEYKEFFVSNIMSVIKELVDAKTEVTEGIYYLMWQAYYQHFVETHRITVKINEDGKLDFALENLCDAEITENIK